MMKRRLWIAQLGAMFACGGRVRAAADEGLFRDLTLDRARSAASTGKKALVVVDFYTTWCAPCKKLDETTWKDPEVKDWLAREAVCLKVDAEKEEALAAKYRVNAYPTILLLRPDGTEVDRLVGYRDPATFLADAGAALAGNDSLSRARKLLEGANAKNPQLRMQYADALVQKGRAEDALSEYLWCFDHGLESESGFYGVRLSFLLSKIVHLGRSHPPALDELRKRRDAAAKAIEARQAEFVQVMEFTALNDNLRESDRTLALYDRVKGDRGQPAQAIAYLRQQSLDQLLAAKRYREVVEEVDVKDEVRRLIDQHKEVEPHMPDDANLRSFMKKQVGLSVAKYYEALLGVKDKFQAAEVAAILEAFDPAGALPPLIAAARRAEDNETADSLANRAKSSK